MWWLKTGNLLTFGGLALVYGLVELLIKTGIVLPYHLQILTLIAINVILVVSLNLINGFTGQFSLGHAGFFAVGAYFSAALTNFYGIPFFLATLLGALVASVIGLVVALPALRLRGDYLAIATLGFGEIIRVVILNIPSVGGARGFSGVPRHTTFGIAYLSAIVTVVVIRHFIESDHGRACLAIREDEIASSSLGVNTTYFKSLAFTIGAFFAGFAGSLFVHYMQYIAPTPTQIGFLRSIDVLIMVVLGGLGSITGSILAAIILTLIPELLRGFAEYRMLIYPVLLVLVMLFRPQGLMAGQELSLETFRRIFALVDRKLRGKRMKAHDSQ